MKQTVFLLALLLALVSLRAEAVDEQEKLKLIQKELKTSQEKLQQTRQQQQDVLGKLVVITQELKKANRTLNKAKDKIQENESKIGQLVVELRKTETDLQQKSNLLQQRVVEAYKSGNIDNLDLLFASGSMSDFLNRLYYFEKVILQDANLVLGVKQDIQQAKVKRDTLTDKTRQIKEMAQVIAEQKQKIAEDAEAKKKALEELKSREKEFEAKVEELQKSSRELEVLIRKKMLERSRVGTKVHGSGVMMWPLQGRLTLRYGARHRIQGRHTGIDIAAPYGSPIVAADDGEVIFAGWWDGYGKTVVVDHGKGRATVYAHLSRIYPTVGATVAKGQTIGLEGSTGYSTGPHLHFEVRINGTPVNPARYLPK